MVLRPMSDDYDYDNFPGIHDPCLGYDAGRMLNGDWIRGLLRQVSEMHGRAAQVDAKSLGSILALQEQIAGEWRAAGDGGLSAVRALLRGCSVFSSSLWNVHLPES